MSKNNLFKIPFGFYCENNKFISKRTQIEELLEGINNDAEQNAALDAEQAEQIAANKEAINTEVERSTDLDVKFEAALETEISERKRMGNILNTKISDVDASLRSLVEETDKAFDIVAEELKQKDIALDNKDVELTASITLVSNDLKAEIENRKKADTILSETIKLNLEEIDNVEATLNESITKNSEEIVSLTEKIETEVSERKRMGGVLNTKISEVTESINNVYDFVKEEDSKLSDAIKSEEARAISVENTKVDWTDLGSGRKSIVLNNHDLILGKNTKGGLSPIAMVSKWDIVDLGTASLPINLNTPQGVRPTVQEKGQTGDQAHKIAYVSDVETVSSKLDAEIIRAEASEKVNADAISNEILERKKEDFILSQKIDNSVTTLNSSISNVNSSIINVDTRVSSIDTRLTNLRSDFDDLKLEGIVLKSIGDLQYALYVDGAIKGTIDIPKDNFLSNVYLTDGDKLHFVFSVGDKYSDIEVDIAKYIDVYTAGNGLSVSSNNFEIVIDSNSEGFLTVSEKGLSLNGVENAINEAVLKEENRALSAEQILDKKISDEKTRAELAEKTNADAIILEKDRATSVEDSIIERVIKVENFEQSIYANSQDIETLETNLLSEIEKTKLLSEKVSSNISDISNLKLVDEEIKNNLTSEIERAKSAEQVLSETIKSEEERAIAVEETKVDWLSLGNDRKAILLNNHDLILGKNSDGTMTYNIAMLSKWDVVDLGTSSLPINLNTPQGVRPTVQEAGQSGDQAHKIAYVSDVETAKAYTDEKVGAISFDGYATEEWVEEKGYLTEHQSLEGYATEQWVEDKAYLQSVPEGYATTDEVIAVVADKVSENALNEAIEDVKTLIPSLNGYATEEWVEGKGYLTEHQSLEGYATEQWVEEQGYLTEHQDISHLASKEEVDALRVLVIELQNKVKELDSRIFTSNQLIEMLSSLEEGETMDVKLYNDVILTEENKLQIPVNATLNLNLNGKTISSTVGDILFRVNGTLNIDGEGKIVGESYVASANEGGVVNVINGTFENTVTSFQANGGVINVEGGYFNTYSETYGTKYTLNHIDAKKEVGLISVKGGIFVNYNPAESYGENPPMNFVAEGYGVVVSTEGENTIYTVVSNTVVSSKEEFTNLFSNLNTDEKAYLTLNDNIEFTSEERIIISGDVTVNLNGYTIQQNYDDVLFRVKGDLTIEGEGTIIAPYNYIAVNNSGSTITVKNGTFSASTTCFQSNGGIINIEGGYYNAYNDRYEGKFTLNFIDSMKEIGEINVTGGSFFEYNPAESYSENPPMNFVEDGYIVEVSVDENNNKIYTVVKE